MKKILLVISCVLILDTSFSQEIEWENTIGGSDWESLRSIHQTNDGGYILGGNSASPISGDKTDDTNGSFDYWILKTDASGNILWQNSIGGYSADDLYSIQQTVDGGYILGGYSASNISGDKTENCLGLGDYWIVKTNASGNIQWQNTIGGSNNEKLYSIEQTTDGGYILGGISDSPISGDKTENCLGGWDYWIVKTDISGSIQWQNTIGGSGGDYLTFIQQTNDGGYILSGHSNSNISGDKTENSYGGYDYWIVKTDLTGNIQWQNTIGGSGDDWLNSIKQTTDGGYILGGHSDSNISGDKTENSNGLYDYWIVKTDASGNIQWQSTIGGSSSDEIKSIQQTADGGYILGGMSLSNISGDKTENCIGGADYWIVKTDASGNIRWQNTTGGSSNDEFPSIEQTADGGYIVGGRSNSSISGYKKENCNGEYDYWIVKLTDKNNLVTGKLFIDSNSNGVQDAGEPPIYHNEVYELNSGRFTFSQLDGSYKLLVLDSGNYSVLSNLNYHNAVPLSHSVYFSGIQQTDSLNDFAFQPAGVFNDLCVHITPLGNFRAGINASYMITYSNVGTTTLNGTVIFLPDSDVTFVSSDFTPTSVTSDSVVWDVGTLTPFQTGNILVTVNVNNGMPIGTLINSGARIEPVAGDANTACNYSYYEVFVTGSYDPNAILVDRDTVLTTELSNPPYLDYIIYFQNTGNDTAFNARVLNNIPDKLDISSFEFVASSHPMNITYGAHARLMTFTFDNILLPDSNVNEPASHGFIRYRIKPLSTLVAGQKIKNTAFIYFDFNQPVQTDTAVTKIVLPTGIEQAAGGSGSKQLKIFPNPASGIITVTVPQLTTTNSQLTIFDLFGRTVYQSSPDSYRDINQQSSIKINVSSFSQGIYFMQLNAGENTWRSKFVKE